MEPNIIAKVKQRKLQWIGHVVRIPERRKTQQYFVREITRKSSDEILKQFGKHHFTKIKQLERHLF